MHAILVPLSWIYGLVMMARNALFDLGVLRVRRAGVPVIAVGNMTAGGTGKTPLVEFLVGHLLTRGIRVAVVSRGYGRTSRGAVIVSDGTRVRVTAEQGGDEAVQVARKFPGVPVVVAERRADGAKVAVTELGAEVLVLDDAFQHRYLGRDLDIVVLDARCDITKERFLPAGRRREPLRGIRRAGLVALSKLPPDRVSVPWIEGVPCSPSTSVIAYRTVPVHPRWVRDDAEVSIATLRSEPVLGLSGIADHERFVEDLRDLGMAVRTSIGFPDHHRYSTADIDRILETLRRTGCAHVATTEKDLARLREGPGEHLLENASVMVLPIVVRWVHGEDVLRAAVAEAVKGTLRA